MTEATDRDKLIAEAIPVLLQLALLSYGTVGVLRETTGRTAERTSILPPGETDALHLYWAQVILTAPTLQHARAALDEARAELAAWKRRPFVRETHETMEELCARIVTDGWGVTAKQCALAMRCTPTFVRRARIAAGRNPENGYHLPAEVADRMQWARELDKAGLSLRQIEQLTGLARSTIYDRLRK